MFANQSSVGGRLFRGALCASLLLSWSNVLPVLQAQQSAPPATRAMDPKTRDEVSAELDRLFAAVAAARRELPRRQFDPEALVEEIGRDPAMLLAWVRDHVRWVPYRGALRGAVGTLMDRSGNSLDRSLLLAEMIAATGFEVRLARGTLAADRARQVLAGLPAPAPIEIGGADDPTTAGRLMTRITAVWPAAAERMQALQKTAKSADQLDQRLADSVQQHAPAILAALPAPRPAAANDDAALAAIAAHWWVQFKKDGAWVDADPLAPAAEAAGAVATPLCAAAETLAFAPGKLPLADADCHSVAVRVIIERQADGKRSEHEVLRHAFRAAEQPGETLVLTHQSLAADATQIADARLQPATLPALLSQPAGREWLPVLQMGPARIVQKSFTDHGGINDHPAGDPRVAQAGKVAGATGDLFSGVTGAQVNQPVAANGPQLTAEWIEYEIRSPGAEPVTVRRPVFDLLGPAARASGGAAAITDDSRIDRGLALLGRVETLPMAGRLAPAYLDDRALGSLLAARNGLTGSIRGPQVDAAALADGLARVAGAPVRQAHRVALARGRWMAARGQTFLDRPNLLSTAAAYTRSRDGAPAFGVRFDLAFNDVAVHRSAADKAYQSRVEQGVFDTAAELHCIGGDPAQNTTGVFQAAAASGAKPVTIRPGDAAGVASLGAGDAAQRVRENLAAGNAVVVAAAPGSPAGSPPRGWWRVHPDTGATVGVMDSGYHQAHVEYVKRQQQAIIAADAYEARLVAEMAMREDTLDMIFWFFFAVVMMSAFEIADRTGALDAVSNAVRRK